MINYFVSYRKKLEEVAFVDEEFLKGVSVDYGTTRCSKVLEDAVKLCPSYENLTALSRWQKYYKIKYQKVLAFYS